MKKFLAAAAAVSLTLVAAPAFAQTVDGSIGYSSVDLDEVTVGAVTARLSWGLNDVFGIEGEASFGVGDDDTTEPGPPPVNVKVSLNHAIAVYGTAGVPLGENGRVYARVGYGTNEIEAKGLGVTAELSDESINYGVGVQLMLAGPNGVRLDYTKHDFSDDGDADVWSISYVRRFR